MAPNFDIDALGRIPDPYGAEGRPVPSPPVVAAAGAAPTRAQRRRGRALALAGALGYEVAWTIVVERRADLDAVPALGLALGLGFPLLACALAASAVLRRGPRGLGASPAYLSAAVLLGPLVFAIGTWLVAPHQAETADVFWSRALRCIRMTAVLAAVPLALGMLAYRRAFVAAATARTTALGVGCGAIAAATMSLVCSDGAAEHVIVAHGAMMLVAGALGALLGRRFARA